jgi:hypothetical protein
MFKEKIKIFWEKIKEIYERGLSEKQRALLILTGVLIVLATTLWIFNLFFAPKGKDVLESQKNDNVTERSAINSDNGQKDNLDKEDSAQTNPTFVFPKAPNQKNDNPVPQLPVIPNTKYQSQPTQSPGPMDRTFNELKAEHKDDPKITLINGFLFYYKQVADGKRAWNDLYRAKSEEFFGKDKATELENEVKRITGDKNLTISNRKFDSFTAIANAIKKETGDYVEKVAINQYLDHINDIMADRYPANDEAINLGEMNLEKAWVDQIYAKVRDMKEKKARVFRARNYKNIEELISAIKNDTKNFKDSVARDAYLSYVLELTKNNALSADVIGSGGYLLENYHLEALSKFINK